VYKKPARKTGDGAHARSVSGRVDRLQGARETRSHHSDLGQRVAGEGGRFAETSQPTKPSVFHVQLGGDGRRSSVTPEQ